MDWKYIAKRIIIGVGIALVIMFIKGNLFIGVKAYDLTSTNLNLAPVTVNSGSAGVDFTITGNPWANWRYGKLYFEFGITKTQGSSTDPLLVPRNVYAISDSTAYSCQFGTTSYANSTWTGASYSVTCPMDLGAPGLTRISILFMPFSGGASSTTTYNIIVGGWATYETVESTQINLDTSTTTTAINNQISNDNTNTQNIINNNNTNTNSIINNQNNNTQQQIESQKVCTTSTIDKNDIITDGYLNNNNGTVSSQASTGVTDFISIDNSSNIIINSPNTTTAGLSYCFYNSAKSYISCGRTDSLSTGYNIVIPSNASYVRFTIQKATNIPSYFLKNCKNGNQAIADSQQQINNSLTDDSINSNTGNDFFDDFNYGDDSLSAVITAPLRFFNKLTETCSPLTLTVYNQTITLPCGSIVWGRSDFSTFVTWWNLFFGGIAIYTLGLKLFKVVHDAIDPTKDTIESVGV